jgi:hypothetical protein
VQPLRLVIELPTAEDVEREWRSHLSCGGAFVPGAVAEAQQPCLLVVIGPGGAQLELEARTVYAGPEGVGVEIADFALVKPTLDEWVQEVSAPPDPDPDPDPDLARDPEARNVFERLRHLTVVQQLKVAREGEVHERMALERIYGKTVWEAILRNPRCTHPEVARIARMGSLPRPLLELIVGNTAWLRSPEVRRALLANLRLGADMIPRILRLLPKHELRLVPNQTAYPSAVRDAARRLLKDT